MAKKECSELTLKGNRSEKSRTISRDVTICIVLVVVVVSSLVISLNYLIVSRKAKAQLMQKADEYLSYLIDSLELSIWAIDEEGVRKIIESYINNELVSKLRITESTGNISFERVKQHEKDLVEKMGVVRHEGQIIGHVEIGLTSRLYKESNRQLLWSSILTMFAIILALIAMTGFLLRIFLKNPLNDLIQGIDRIAKGEYEYSVHEPKQREIETIISRFNYMAEKIKGREKSLSEVNRRLEDEILEHKRAQEALRESEGKFRSLVETTSDWIWEVDANGIYVYASPKVKDLLGYEPEEIVGRTPFDLMVPEEAKHVAEEFNAFMEACELFYGLENLNLHKDGRTVLLESSGVPILDTNGRLLGYRGIDRDITERKKAEEELRKHREQLEDLVKERTNELEATQEELVKHEKLAVLGQLTATVSHELRNPLAVIRSSAFYVESKLSDVDEKITKHLKRIDEQVDLCDSIIGDLFEYTRGRLSEKFKGDLNTWLERVLNEISIPEEVSVVRELYPGLPMIPFDRDKLERVVINLVNNAFQAVIDRQERCQEEKRPYRPQVKLTTSMVEDGVCIEVEDNGIGMDEETAGRAFEPLFTTRARGSGLGLAIVKKIVEEHGGAVSIESEPDRATKAIVVIPHK